MVSAALVDRAQSPRQAGQMSFHSLALRFAKYSACCSAIRAALLVHEVEDLTGLGTARRAEGLAGIQNLLLAFGRDSLAAALSITPLPRGTFQTA